VTFLKISFVSYKLDILISSAPIAKVNIIFNFHHHRKATSYRSIVWLNKAFRSAHSEFESTRELFLSVFIKVSNALECVGTRQNIPFANSTARGERNVEWDL
jgi:hypothetical protein